MVIRLPYPIASGELFRREMGRTARRDVLDHLLICGCRHLEYVLREFVEHYEQAQPHQGWGSAFPGNVNRLEPLGAGLVERRDRLLGALHEYDRQAA